MKDDMNWRLGLMSALVVLFVLASSGSLAFAQQANYSGSVSIIKPVATGSVSAAAAKTSPLFKRVIFLGSGNGIVFPDSHQFTVPEREGITLEFMGGEGCVASADHPELVIYEVDAAGTLLGFYRFGSNVPTNSAGMVDPFGHSCYAFQQPLTIYLDPGSLVTVAYDGTKPIDTHIEITLSGTISSMK